MTECGFLLKLASSGKPTAFHAAVISPAELKLLNLVKDIERGGRVTSIDSRGFDVVNGGRRDMPEGTLYIDCAAETVKSMPQVPIYQPGTIVIPFMSAGIPSFSAALIARLECYSPDDKVKNTILRPYAFPDKPHEMFENNQIAASNLANIFAIPELAKWTLGCRLSPTGPPKYRGPVTGEDIRVMASAFANRRDSAEKLIRAEAARGSRTAVDFLKSLA